MPAKLCNPDLMADVYLWTVVAMLKLRRGEKIFAREWEVLAYNNSVY